MAGPITWRTVNGPSLAEASRPMEYAQRSFDNAFTGLGGVLKQAEATDAANWNQVKENNTQDFLNKLYSAQGAEGFKALQDSGQLDQILAANGAQIDRAAARSAMDGRLSTLQNRDVQGIAYKGAMDDAAQAPDVRRIGMLTLTDPKAAAAELAARPDLRAGVQLAQGIDTRNQTLVERGRGNTRFEWDGQEQKWKAAAEDRNVAAESQRALLRPIELEGAQLGNQGKRMQNSLTGLQITDAKASAADKAEARRLDNTLAVAQQNYLDSRDATGRDMGALAQQLDLPMTSIGHPDFSNMTTDQLAVFDKAAGALPNKMPLSKDFMSGDTKVANKFYQSLVDSKQYTPATLKKFKDSIRGAFDSNATGGRVGNDAYNRDLANAQNQVAFDSMNANNWYAPGSPNAIKDYDKLAKEVDVMFGKDEREDLPDVQKYLSELATKGVVVGKDKQGKDIVVTPSVNDVLGAVRGTYEGWNFYNSGRKTDIKKALEAALKTPQAATRFQQGQEAEAYRRKQAVSKILGGEK